MQSIGKYLVLMGALALLMPACQQPTYDNSDELDIHTPYFAGSWTLTKVDQTDTRVAPGGLRSLDVTPLFLDQSSSFTFTADGTFTATGFFANQIGGSGSWQLDDARFPTEVQFTNSEGTATTLELGASVIEFSDQMKLVNVSMGCDGDPATSYTYTFDKQ